MKKIIEKLIGRLEEIPVGLVCCECPNILKCNEIEDSGIGKNVDLCGATIKQLAIESVNQIAEEYKDINIITDFLQYVRNNADNPNYENDNGWSLADLIDLSIKFCEAEEYNNGWIPCSERLPQENEPVDTVCEVVNVMLKSGTVTSGWYNRYLERWYVLDEHCDYPLQQNYENVIAWQPLPAPYQPKGE